MRTLPIDTIHFRISKGDSGRAECLSLQQPKAEILAMTEDHLSVRVPGYSAWAGRMTPREYVPSEIQVYEISAKFEYPAFIQLECKPILIWEIKRKRREEALYTA